MKPEDAKAVVIQDLATVEIIGLLLSFLQAKGIVDRREFIAFTRAALEQWKSEGQPADLAAALKSQIDGLDLDCDLPRIN